MDKVWDYLWLAIGYAMLVIHGAADWAFMNSGTLCLMALTAAVIFGWYEYTTFKGLRRAKGDDGEMARRKIAQLKDRYADKIHDFLFEDLVSGVIDGKQYRQFCLEFGKGCDLKGLQTKSFRKDRVWWRVKKATTSMRLAMQNIKPGTIPGPKPGETVQVDTFGSKLLARHKAA